MLDDHSQRLLKLEGTLNVRDLGGYPAGNGQHLRWRRLIRAENLDKLTPVALQELLDYKVALIVDLRTSQEVKTFPNLLAGSSRVVYRHRPLFDNELEAQLARCENYTELNRLVLEICQPQIRNIFEAMVASDSSQAILFHCASGKDRTGLIAGLLLNLVGVPDELVAEDYSLSAGYLEPRISLWRQEAIAGNKDMVRFEIEVGSDPQVMLETLNYLQHHYGEAFNYLTKTCGIMKELVEEFQNSLLE